MSSSSILPGEQRNCQQEVTHEGDGSDSTISKSEPKVFVLLYSSHGQSLDVCLWFLTWKTKRNSGRPRAWVEKRLDAPQLRKGFVFKSAVPSRSLKFWVLDGFSEHLLDG